MPDARPILIVTADNDFRAALSLQLPIGFEMCLLRDGLMGSSPERPGDDVGGSDAFSCETLGYPADFLDRPADEVG